MDRLKVRLATSRTYGEERCVSGAIVVQRPQPLVEPCGHAQVLDVVDLFLPLAVRLGLGKLPRPASTQSDLDWRVQSEAHAHFWMSESRLVKEREVHGLCPLVANLVTGLGQDGLNVLWVDRLPAEKGCHIVRATLLNCVEETLDDCVSQRDLLEEVHPQHLGLLDTGLLFCFWTTGLEAIAGASGLVIEEDACTGLRIGIGVLSRKIEHDLTQAQTGTEHRVENDLDGVRLSHPRLTEHCGAIRDEVGWGDGNLYIWASPQSLSLGVAKASDLEGARTLHEAVDQDLKVCFRRHVHFVEVR